MITCKLNEDNTISFIDGFRQSKLVRIRNKTKFRDYESFRKNLIKSKSTKWKIEHVFEKAYKQIKGE